MGLTRANVPVIAAKAYRGADTATLGPNLTSPVGMNILLYQYGDSQIWKGAEPSRMYLVRPGLWNVFAGLAFSAPETVGPARGLVLLNGTVPLLNGSWQSAGAGISFVPLGCTQVLVTNSSSYVEINHQTGPSGASRISASQYSYLGVHYIGPAF